MREREFLKNKVLSVLSEKLNPFGFKLKKSASEFIKKTSFGWNKYQIVFLVNYNKIEIKPSLLVRFDVVEDFYHKISEFEEKYKKGTPTLGVAIEDLNYNSDLNCRFYLTHESQIDGIVKNLVDLFEMFALPFFNEFDNLSRVDKKLNDNPSDTLLTGAIFKGLKSLIIANLIKRGDYENLEKTYTTYYEDFANGFYLKEFLRLKELLDSKDYN